MGPFIMQFTECVVTAFVSLVILPAALCNQNLSVKRSISRPIGIEYAHSWSPVQSEILVNLFLYFIWTDGLLVKYIFVYIWFCFNLLAPELFFFNFNTLCI